MNKMCQVNESNANLEKLNDSIPPQKLLVSTYKIVRTTDVVLNRTTYTHTLNQVERAKTMDLF